MIGVQYKVLRYLALKYDYSFYISYENHTSYKILTLIAASAMVRLVVTADVPW